MSAITIGRCKDCRFRTDNDCCAWPKLREYDNTASKHDDDHEGGHFWVGPDFGCVHWTPRAGSDNKLSAEQQARDLLERMEIPRAQHFSSGELVELANLIAGIRDGTG